MNTRIQPNALDVSGAAKFLGVSVATIRKWVLTRHIPFYKMGSRVTFDTDELRDWRKQFHVEVVS